MRWYYVDDNSKRHGPFRDAELSRLLQNKTITRQTYVWNGKSVKDWTKIMDIEGLEDHSGIPRSSSIRSDRSGPLAPPARRHSKHKLAVGDQIYAYDTTKNLEPAKVVELKDDKVKIHYNNWSYQWDEWLPLSSPRIQQLVKQPSRRRRESKSKRNSVSLKLISSGEEGFSTQDHKQKRRSSTNHSISLSLIGPRLEDYTASYPNLEQLSKKQDGKNLNETNKSKELVEQEAAKLVQERLNIEKERKTFFKVKEELRISLLEGRQVDTDKLMENMEKFRIENVRLQSEHKNRATEINNLQYELFLMEQKEKSKEDVHKRIGAQLAELESMFKKREAELSKQEDNITLKARQVEVYKIDSGRTKHIKKEISSAENNIQILEDVLSKNIGKALAIRKHDTHALRDLRDMKKKLFEEREKLKKDRDKVLQGLNQVHLAKSQLREANRLLEDEKSKINAWGVELKKQDEENASRHKEGKVGFQKARKRLNAKMEKVEKDQAAIERDKVALKEHAEEQIAQLKTKFSSVQVKLKEEEEAIHKKQVALGQQEREMSLKEKQLDEELRNAEEQRKELMESTQSDQQKVVDQLSTRVKDLDSQLVQLKDEKNKLTESFKTAKDDLSSKKNKVSEALGKLNTEKAERKRLRQELLECKDSIQIMKEQTLKHQVAKEVWESITERIRVERDKFRTEIKELREKANSFRKELAISRQKLQEKSNAETESNIAESIIEHNRKLSTMSFQQFQSSLPGSEDAIPPDHSRVGTTSNFEQLLQTIIDSRKTQVKNEEEVKKRMEQCMAELEDDDATESDDEFDEYDDETETDEEDEDIVIPPQLNTDTRESSEFFQDL